MGRPRAREVVALRDPTPLCPAGTRWIVTARYDVQVAPGQFQQCVRLRASYLGGGNGAVRHFRVEEFRRLFVAAAPSVSFIRALGKPGRKVRAR